VEPVWVSGCATSPVTGKSILVGMSEAQEVQTDAQVAPHQFSQDLGAIQDEAVNRYIAGIGQRMGVLTHRPQMPYSYRVLNANYVNAYTFPGGAMGVTRGILADLDDEAQLAALLGHEPGDLPAAVGQCQHAPQLAQPIPVGDGAALLKRRPDVRAAERELAAATAQIGVATAAMYPEISLGGNFGYTGMMQDIGHGITKRWLLGPHIAWHIPTGVDHARVRASEAGADAALARFDGVVLGALRETQTLLSHYAHDLSRNQSLREARDAARQAADYNRRMHQEGRLPYLSSLDAERTLASAEAALAASEAQLSQDQVNLFLSLGGGWENTRGSSGAEPHPEGAEQHAGGAAQERHGE